MKRVILKENIEHNEKVNGHYETLFHNANGYIGVRGCLEEGVPSDWDTMRGTYINGFYDVIPMKQAESLCNFVEKKETMLNVADLQTIHLKIEDEVFDLTTGTILKNSRTLNMEDGYTLREVVWRSPKGREIELVSKRMTSFEKLTLFMMEYQVTALNFDGMVEVESWHIADVKNYCNPKDPRLAAESIQNLQVQSMEIVEEYSIATSKTLRSKLRMCSAVTHQVRGCEKIERNLEKFSETMAMESFNTYLKEEDKIVIEKYCIITDSIRYPEVEKKAKEELLEAVEHGFKYYMIAQRKYLDHFWNQSEMEIMGDDAINNAVSFNMYQLLQSCAKDSYCNVAAKGLSGEGYEGHYFWDTEMFITPFFILTNPELAKMLISYRYDTLNKARDNAKLLGHKQGALFPWRTITGIECSGYYPSGTAQYHIDGDIAYAVISYYLTTGDLDFIEEKGAEIVMETARLWMNLGNYADGKFVLNAVTGPDEYTCMVNNNYFTNCSAKYNLRWAVKLIQLLKKENRFERLCECLKIDDIELNEMSKAADAMLLLYDEELGINPQDDSFLDKPVWDIEHTPKENFPLLLHYHPLHLYRYQICKQADTVLSYFLYEEEQSYEVMKRSFEYYEKITTHDSSLSTCTFSMVASRLGLQEKGYAYFGDSAKLDIENTHNNTKDGIHTANMGGCYMAIVNGFAGLRIKEDSISLTPFVPNLWEGYQFKIRYQGSLIKVMVTKREVRVDLLEGREVPMKIYDKNFQLQEGRQLVATNLKAVIFDLDGVIVFTDQFHYKAWKYMAYFMGIYFDEEINNRLRGVSRMDSLEIILERYTGKPLSRKKKEELAAKKNDIYRELLKTMTPKDVTDEVRETLAELKRRGYKVAIGSSSKNTKFILEQVDLLDVFDAISDGTNITKSKPDPEVFLKVAQFLGEDPKDCLVVEDAGAGIYAGNVGGFQTAAIGDAVKFHKSDYELTILSDLLRILV